MDTIAHSSANIEMAIVGAVAYGKYAGEIFAQVDSTELKDDEFCAIFEHFKRRWKERGEVNPGDIASLPDHLKEPAFIAAQTLPTVEGYQQYIDMLKERNAVITAQVLGGKLMICDNIDEVNELTDELAASIKLGGSTASASIGDLLEEFSKTRSTPKTYITTGFPTLNKYMYLDKGDYVVVGARPSEGKTALALNMATRMAKSGLRVGFFSLETSELKLMDRIIAETCGVDFSRIKRGDITSDEWRRIAETSIMLESLPLYLIPASGKTVSWIAAESLRLNLDAIFIDYLGLITGPGRSIYEQVTNISKDLHNFAQQHKVLVVALSQLNRGEPSQMPTLERLRESGQIEQDVDAAILLHNPPSGEDMRECKLIIAKNKEGICGAVDMVFDGSHQRFSVMESAYE